jgi:PilZ domain
MTDEFRDINRRMNTRHRAKTEVRVRTKTKSKLCTCVNISVDGCAVTTDDMNLKKNEAVELTFIIRLGKVAKLHKRKAIVIYVKDSITGFLMGKYEDPSI